MSIVRKNNTVSYTNGVGQNREAEAVIALSPSDTRARYYAQIPAHIGYGTNPTDMITVMGAAGKIIRVSQMRVAINTTAAGRLDAKFIKRTTLNTGGTSTPVTVATSNTTDPAASASVKEWTVIPASLGTATQTGTYALVTTVPTSAPAQFALNIPFPEGIILTNANESISFGLAGAALPAGFTAIVDISWTEEDA